MRIEHRYPTALGFLRQQGPEALVVLHDLLVRSHDHYGELITQASTRDIAEQLGFLSKDTVHRRLRQLARAGVIERVDSPTGSIFEPTIYVIHLANSGITVDRSPSTPISALPA